MSQRRFLLCSILSAHSDWSAWEARFTDETWALPQSHHLFKIISSCKLCPYWPLCWINISDVSGIILCVYVIVLFFIFEFLVLSLCLCSVEVLSRCLNMCLTGHGEYSYLPSSSGEQGYERPFDEASQHYYEGGRDSLYCFFFLHLQFFPALFFV